MFGGGGGGGGEDESGFCADEELSDDDDALFFCGSCFAASAAAAASLVDSGLTSAAGSTGFSFAPKTFSKPLGDLLRPPLLLLTFKYRRRIVNVFSNGAARIGHRNTAICHAAGFSGDEKVTRRKASAR